MRFKDYYQTLGVGREAEPDAIKRAYRRLARKFHPDVSTEPDAEERFKELGEAYEVLKDPDKRAAYDAFGADWQAGQEFRPPPDWPGDFAFSDGGFSDRGSPDGGFSGGDFSGRYSGGPASGEFSEFFESLFGRAAGRRSDRRARSGHPDPRIRGEDVHARVTIPVEDAYAGATRRLTLQAPELDGAGHVRPRTRTLEVRIPAGVTEGQRVRLAGQGGPGVGGAPAGDLYLEVALEPHPLYRVEGRDVYVEVPVAPWEAALGRTVTVPTLGGKVKLAIPAGSQSGARLRLAGRGLPGRPAGDQYAVLSIVLPSARSERARALFEQMEREIPFDPRAELGD